MKIEIMKEELKKYQTLIEAWENVKVVTKKDGREYKNLKRNFKNCNFFKKNGLQYISVSIRKSTRIYSEELIISNKHDNTAKVYSLITNRIKMLEKSVKLWEEAVDIIENNTIDVKYLAKNIMNDVKEKCNGNTTAISHYKFELMEELKKY